MVWRFPNKRGIKPPYDPYDPAIPLLGIYTEETKIEKNTCIPFFTAALFTIASVQLVAQLCPTLCDPMNCSTPGFPVYPTVYSATVNIVGTRVFQFWFPWGICLGVGLLGHIMVLFLVF